KEAFELANVLENPLRAPLTLKASHRVDPTLGKDSIRSGIKAAIAGTLAVSIFMLVYYMIAGMVANVALIANIIILLGVMCSIGTTLTLPGIAGVVLTVGMAVDANVLIYERIREELGKGKSLRGAIAAGYRRAFGTILDSNVAHNSAKQAGFHETGQTGLHHVVVADPDRSCLRFSSRQERLWR